MEEKYGAHSVNPFASGEILQDVLDCLDYDLAKKFKAVPLSKVKTDSKTVLTVAMVDPSNTEAIGDIEFLSGCEVKPVHTTEAMIWLFIEKYYPPPIPLTEEEVSEMFELSIKEGAKRFKEIQAEMMKNRDD
jgi:hypothetical protein